MEQASLVLIKPDGIAKNLTGNVISRLTECGLEIIASKVVKVSKGLAEEHYKQLKGQPFFDQLIDFIQGKYHKKNKVFALIYYGEDAISKIRKIAGATNPEEAEFYTIRGAYGRITTKGLFENVIHASSDAKEAEREIKLWFDPDEIIIDLYPTEKVNAAEEKAIWKNES